MVATVNVLGCWAWVRQNLVNDLRAVLLLHLLERLLLFWHDLDKPLLEAAGRGQKAGVARRAREQPSLSLAQHVGVCVRSTDET